MYDVPYMQIIHTKKPIAIHPVEDGGDRLCLGSTGDSRKSSKDPNSNLSELSSIAQFDDQNRIIAVIAVGICPALVPTAIGRRIRRSDELADEPVIPPIIFPRDPWQMYRQILIAFGTLKRSRPSVAPLATATAFRAGLRRPVRHLGRTKFRQGIWVLPHILGCLIVAEPQL